MINELFCVFMKGPGTGKKTSQCKPWIKEATKYRDNHGVEAFNKLLKEFYKLKDEANKE